MYACVLPVVLDKYRAQSLTVKVLPQEYGKLLYNLMQCNHGVLKGVVTQETMLGTELVLHHALVWITHILKNLDAEISGFVTVKLMYTTPGFTQHSDMTESMWKQLRSEDIPLQPLLPKVGSKLTRSAVSLSGVQLVSESPFVSICPSETCFIQCCVSVRESKQVPRVRKKLKAQPEAGSSQTGDEGGRAHAVHALGNITTELELQGADAKVRSGGVGNQLGLNAEDELAVALVEGVDVDSVLTESMGLGGFGESEGWGNIGKELGLGGGDEGDVGGGNGGVGGGGVAEEVNNGTGADEITNNSEGSTQSRKLERRIPEAVLEGQHQSSSNSKKRLHNQDTGSTEGGEVSQDRVALAVPSDKRRNSHSVAWSEDSQVGNAGLRLSSAELAGVDEFCAPSEGEPAQEDEGAASISTKAATMPLTSAAFIEKFQREQTVMFSAHFEELKEANAMANESRQGMIGRLQTANDALVHKNTELVFGNATLQAQVTQHQAQVTQLKTQLLESKTLLQAQHQAEVAQLKTQLKTQLLESKTLLQAQHQAEIAQLKTQLLEAQTHSQVQAQDHGTLLRKYQNLQVAVRRTGQDAHRAINLLQLL